nr:reverse transcriptase domain-containing protein [Tanacetum cinerariifolium]
MLQSVKSYLGRCFAMKDLGEAAYILGIKIYRDKLWRLIGLYQSAYIKDILKRYCMANSKRGSIPMQEKLKLSKSQGASTPAELKRMQNVPYASAAKVPSCLWVRVVEGLWVSWVESDINELRNMMASYFQKFTASTSGSASHPSNNIANPRGVSYDGPPIPPSFSSLPKVVERVPEVTKDMIQPSTKNIQPSVAQTQVPIDEPIVTPKPKPTIPYPSRVTKQKLCEKDDNLALKFVEIFRKLHFDLSFADALLHIPKFTLMFKSLLNNKEKLFDLAMTPVNENCSAKAFFSRTYSYANDSGACRPIDDSTSRHSRRRFCKSRKVLFPTDFVVVDYVVDPHVPLILERPFLRTGRALIDVYGEELTLRVDDEAITFKEYVEEVLGFFDNSKSGNPTLMFDLIVALSSPSLTHFKGGGFILEEIEAYLTSKSIPPEIDDTDFDLEGDKKLKPLNLLSMNHQNSSLRNYRAENLAADHVSRLENPHQDKLEKKEITETFPLETLEAKALPTNDARVVVKFLKSLFARFGTPRAIISDCGTHFCNDQFAKVMLKKAQNPLDWTVHRSQVFPYGIIELSQIDRPNFKVNDHRLKYYFGGDIPQLVVSNLQTFPMDQ